MLARFFRVGSSSAGFSLIIFSMFLCCLIICDISFSESVRWDRNRKPFGDMVSYEFSVSHVHYVAFFSEFGEVTFD